MTRINGVDPNRTTNSGTTEIKPKTDEPEINSVVAEDPSAETDSHATGWHAAVTGGFNANRDLISGLYGQSHINVNLGYRSNNMDYTANVNTAGSYNAIDLSATRTVWSNSKLSAGVGANVNYNLNSTNTRDKIISQYGNITETYKPNTLAVGTFGSVTYRPAKNLSLSASVGPYFATNGKSETCIVDDEEIIVGGDRKVGLKAKASGEYNLNSYTVRAHVGIDDNANLSFGAGVGLKF